MTDQLPFTERQIIEIRTLAANRWPRDEAAGAQATWNDWLRSLRQFSFADIMGSLILLSEVRERFPSLSRLIAACQEQLDERMKRQAVERGAQPRLPSPATVAARLEQFDRSAETFRQERHAEFQRFAQLNGLAPEELAAGHVRIDAVGANELRERLMIASEDPELVAREWLADPSAARTEAIKQLPEAVRTRIREAVTRLQPASASA